MLVNKSFFEKGIQLRRIPKILGVRQALMIICNQGRDGRRARSVFG